MKRKEHPLYGVWNNMMQRCFNPKSINYKYYGGRGITVCGRWQDLWLFIEDIGEKPDKAYSIDRINNDGNYEPDNVRWATKQEQVINRGIQINNTSGYVGVSWDKSRNKWKAYVKRDNKMINIGRYNTKKEAIKAREEFLK